MGFLQVGPMYYPPQPNAAQVIQRGPHGWRFGTGPQRQADGTYRWWNEQGEITGDYKGMWQPTQSIVGVLGLGSFGASDVIALATGGPIGLMFNQAAKALAKPASAPVAPAAFVASTQSYDAAVSGLKSAREQAALGNQAGAVKALGFARTNMNALSPTERARLQGEFDATTYEVYKPRTSSQVQQGRDNFDARVQRQRAEAAEETERARREQQTGTWTDPSSWVPDWLKTPGDLKKELSDTLADTAKKVVVVGGLGLLIYGLAKGVGSGLATRSRTVYVRRAPRRRNRR